MRPLVWRGLDVFRADIEHVEVEARRLRPRLLAALRSLPVLRHALHRGGEARDLTMAWVSVPDLAVSASEQRYEPLDRDVVRFRSGAFSADLELDADGFVVRYPGLAERVA